MQNLEIPEMIQLSRPLLTPGARQHESLLSVPSASACLPAITAAHDGLVALSAGVNPQVLASAVRALVEQHDEIARHLDLRLQAEIVAASESERPAFVQARDQILPEGLGLVRKSAAAKAGEREVRVARVSAESLALLATVPLRGRGTLADAYDRLQATCLELSVAEAERGQRLAELSGPRVRDARKRWVAAIELIEMSMSVAGADPTPVLGRIRAAQLAAEPTIEEPGAPTPPDAPTPAPTPA
jgi:hypothetical protein